MANNVFNGSVSITSDLVVMTYNCHGFNQGSILLKEICESKVYHCIFLQELWLTPNLWHKIQNLSAHYTCYGISSMEAAVERGILQGRPYGGTAILVRNELIKSVYCVSTFDRVVSLEICDFLFINVYLPCEDGSALALNSLHEILANMSDIIEQSQADYVVFGGDLNVNIDKSTALYFSVNEWLTTYKLINAQIKTTDSFYTFSNEKLNRFSAIDFICVTKSLKETINNYSSVDSAINLSDHLPVKCSLTVPKDSQLCIFIQSGHLPNHSDRAPCTLPNKNNKGNLRWDHADIDRFYNVTRELLYPVYNDVECLHNQLMSDDNYCNDINNVTGGKALIELYYNKTVSGLLNASAACIPSIPPKCLKVWWNSELAERKRQSIASHNLWIASGKPKSGAIFINKTKSKIEYKAEIKKAKTAATDNISYQLHESLLGKSHTAFWKTWKNKISKTENQKVRIENDISDKDAADKFAIFFQSASTPNSTLFNDAKINEYNEKVANYSGDSLSMNRLNFNAELIGIAVCKLSSGKSPGCDNVTTEHLINCHPILFSLLAKLFNIMIQLSYVPSDFGRGITIPIPKNESRHGVHPIDSFRGITLSPVLSKVFEHCILMGFSQYLLTSDNQFGFKKKIGCSHAIYTLQKVVDFYVSNDSTINICLLDVSKAFDKINHSVLLLKLMQRNLPAKLVKLLHLWYSISSNIVRWGEELSSPYILISGVRQGSVISPVLFSIYVDDMLNKFGNFGCRFHGLSVSALMYADDLVILSPSIHEL
jgi:exonuclease III